MNVKNPYRFKKMNLWNLISGGIYDSVFLSVTPPEATPWNLCFSEDGTKLYITGNTGDKCRQYSGTAWDLSTFTDDSKEHIFTTQTAQPFQVRWKTDGTKCYAVGRNNYTLWQYTASTAWDISTLSYDSKSLVLNDTSTTFNDAFFNADGTILITLSQLTGNLQHYALSTAWDISTGVYDATKSGAWLDPQNEGMFIHPNGLQFYLIESGDDRVHELLLTVAWDFSTITTPYSANISALSVTTEESVARGIAFKSDGSKFYVVGSASDKVHQYSL